MKIFKIVEFLESNSARLGSGVGLPRLDSVSVTGQHGPTRDLTDAGTDSTD
jgi:hypothetical protein